MMGFEVHEAADGRELFWALEEQARKPGKDPSLVIADVYTCLPTTGSRCSRRGRDAIAPRNRVIFITAFPDAVVARRVKALGAELLPKPFTLNAFSECVRSSLRRVLAPS